MEQEQINLLHHYTNQGIQQLQRDSNKYLTNKQEKYSPIGQQALLNHANKINISLNNNPSVQTNKESIQVDPFVNRLLNQSHQSRLIHKNQLNLNKSVQYSAHQNTIKIKPCISQQEHFGNSLSNNLSYQFLNYQNYQNLSDNKNTPVGYFSNINNNNNMNKINTINTMQFIQPQIKSYYQSSSSNSFHNYSQVKPYVFSQPTSSFPPQSFKLHQNQQIDQQYEKPLMNKVRNKFPHKQNKHRTLISQDQIKRGFNNSLQIALQKVNRKQQQQQQQRLQLQQVNQKPIKNHQIQIVSNLVHQTYSPLKSQHLNSSEKKGKKKIFQNSKSRDKTRSLYEQSIVSFGTPQSMKMMNNNLKNSVFDYELKTQRQEENEMEKKVIVRRNDQVVYNEQQKQIQIPNQIVPEHILKAWQKLKDKK